MPAQYRWKLTRPGHAVVVTVNTTVTAPGRKTEPGRGGVGIGSVNPFEDLGEKPHLAGMMATGKARRETVLMPGTFTYTVPFPHVVNVENISSYLGLTQLTQVELVIMAMSGYEYVLGAWHRVTVSPAPINYYTVAAMTEYRYGYVPAQATVLDALAALGYRKAGAAGSSAAIQLYEPGGTPALPATKAYPTPFRF